MGGNAVKERALGALEKVKSAIGALNRKTKILIGSIAVVALAIIAGLAIYNGAKASDYTVLFSELNNEEASTIMTKLDEYGASYQYKGDGSILVLTEQEPQLKAKLLQEGYPKSGLTYDIFKDNVSMMTTDYEKRQYQLYELQDRMQATLRCFDGVKDAIVTITPEEDSSYVLDTDALSPAKASVTLTMKDGEELDDEQVEAIQNMVARAVPGLEAENISIADTSGKSYSLDDSGDAAQDKATALKMDTERQIETSTRSKVLEVLEGFYGEGNVRVSVKSTVEVKRTLSQTTTYTSPEGAQEGQGILNQVSKDQEVIRPTTETNAGGVVGTNSNSDINTYVNENTGTVGPNDTYAADRTQTNYSLNEVKQQDEDYAPELTDLSIAVSINGTDLGNFNEEQIIAHIARAAGVQQDDETAKISVAVAPFYDPNATEDEPQTSMFNRFAEAKVFGIPLWIILGAIAGIVLLLVILLVVLLRRRKKKRMLLETQQMDAEKAALRAELERQQKELEMQHDLLNIKNEKNMELKENIRKFSEESPEVAADLLGSWLRGGDEE